MDGIAVGTAWTVQAAVMSRIDAAEYFIVIWAGYWIIFWTVAECWVKWDFMWKAAGSKFESDSGFGVFEMGMLLIDLV